MLCKKPIENICFFFISVMKLSSNKRGGISGIFYHYKMFLGLTNRFFLEIMGYLIFSQVFVKEINSLSPVIKFSRKLKSLSNLPFWIYSTIWYIAFIFDFMVSFIRTGSLSSIVICMLGTKLRKMFSIV